jgi:hypothetical protein
MKKGLCIAHRGEVDGNLKGVHPVEAVLAGRA